MKKGVTKTGKLPMEGVTKSQYIRGYRKTIEVIAEESRNHFLRGFRKGGQQTNDSRSGWERRKSKKDNAGRAILVKTGALARSIEVLSLSGDSIMIGTQRIPYAARHNSGLKGMPPREFLGHSNELDIANNKRLIRFLRNIVKAGKV